MAIQSVIFSTSESPGSVNSSGGWTVAPARAWLKLHGFKFGRVDRPDNGTQLRFRQFEPDTCVEDSFKTIKDFPRGVSAVDCTKA